MTVDIFIQKYVGVEEHIQVIICGDPDRCVVSCTASNFIKNFEAENEFLEDYLLVSVETDISSSDNEPIMKIFAQKIEE